MPAISKELLRAKRIEFLARKKVLAIETKLMKHKDAVKEKRKGIMKELQKLDEISAIIEKICKTLFEEDSVKKQFEYFLFEVVFKSSTKAEAAQQVIDALRVRGLDAKESDEKEFELLELKDYTWNQVSEGGYHVANLDPEYVLRIVIKDTWTNVTPEDDERVLKELEQEVIVNEQNAD